MLIAVVVLAVLGLPPLVADVRPAQPDDSFGAASSSRPATPQQAPTVPADENEPSAVVPAMAAADEVAGRFSQRGLWGLAVLDRQTGDLAVGRAGSQPVFAASLSKLILAVDVLDRRRMQGLALSDADVDRLRRALGPSDDGAMNALWTRFDGMGAIRRVSDRLELTATRPPVNPSQWGEVMISAEDAVALWQYVLDDMAADDADLLVSWMSAAPPTAADGFDQEFGLLDADATTGLRVAKQGWMCCHSGQFTLHSAGAFGTDLRYVAAVLTRQPRDAGWALASQRITEVTNALMRGI